MTWKILFAKLSDPIVFGGLVLLVIGEFQAQSDIFLSWLGPEAAGRVLSGLGVLAMLIRHVQSLPASKGEIDETDTGG